MPALNTAQQNDSSSLLKDIMTTSVTSVTRTYTVAQVLKLAKQKNVTGFPVVDANSKVIGVVSTYDLITDITVGKLNAKLGELPLAIKVEKEVVKLNQFASVKDAIKLLIKQRLGRIIVVDDHDKLCGIVTRKDIVDYFIDVYQLNGEQPYR